ncbi:MAG: hypothetical protein JW946_03580 [Candidatus Omnitrophica bacterium]|nr:hypothetical protein [Candidatus Omnitrophota bacterium]
MKIITEKININELNQMADNMFGNLVKAVVDVHKDLIAVDAELHSDLEALLLDNGSKQKDLWGVNLYPKMQENAFIEFDSIINIRPSQGNRARGVDSEQLRNKIIEIVKKQVVR